MGAQTRTVCAAHQKVNVRWSLHFENQLCPPGEMDIFAVGTHYRWTLFSDLQLQLPHPDNSVAVGAKRWSARTSV